MTRVIASQSDPGRDWKSAGTEKGQREETAGEQRQQEAETAWMGTSYDGLSQSVSLARRGARAVSQKDRDSVDATAEADRWEARNHRSP